MARTPERFLRDLLREVLTRAAARARPLIPSKTLRQSLTKVFVSDTVAKLTIPHYWAIYVHDGRGPITKRSGFLVWFRDPGDDPRTSGGLQHPVRASEIRRLTKTQFQAGLRANREHLASGGDPFLAPMIVTKRVKGVTPTPFFSKGMVGFIDTAGPLMAKRFDNYIQQLIDSGKLFGKDEAVLRL